MLATEPGLTNPPHIAGVAAERVPDSPGRFEPREPAVLCDLGHLPGGSSSAVGASVRDANAVEIKEIVGAPGQVVDDLVGLAQPVGRGLRHRVGLRPDELPARQPPVSGEREQHPLRCEDETLARYPHPAGTGERVTEIEEQTPGGPEHPPDLSKHRPEVRDVSVDGRLAAELPRHAVITEAVVGRRGDAGIHRARGKLAEPRPRVTGKDRVTPQPHATSPPIRASVRPLASTT